MTVQTDTLLEVATRVLVADPSASLAEVARAAGMSRTSLHSRYPTRTALLTALAHEAMNLVERAYAGAHLDDDDVGAALGRLVDRLVPLGPRVEFLLRERALDAEASVVARYETLDQPLIERIARAQHDGQVRADLPAWWVAAALLAAVYSAWEAVADGRLAPRDAPALVRTTVLHGVGTT